MNTANSSSHIPPHTRESFELGATAKKSLFQTPEKENVFDPDELMKMDLIPTPPSAKHQRETTEQATSKSTLDPAKWSTIAKMNVRARMICHQDFPQLLHLLHIFKHNIQCSNETNEATVKLMKDENKLNNIIIYRGQCSITDYHMDYYRSHLQNSLKLRANTRTASNKYGEFTSPFFSPVNEQRRGKIMTTSDLLKWAEPYVTISQSMNKQRTLAQLKGRCGSKITALKKNMKKEGQKKQGTPKTRPASSMEAAVFQPIVGIHRKVAAEQSPSAAAAFGSSLIAARKPSLPGPSAFQDISSLRIDAHSHFTHSKDDIASDVAITMTPRPFKKSKTYGSPPSRVITQRTEVLSDITTRSEKGVGINASGDHVAAPRIQLFANQSPSPIAKFSLSKIKEDPTEEDHENCPATMKENNSLPTDEASKTPNESIHKSETKVCVKKDPENAGIQAPHILAVAFS